MSRMMTPKEIFGTTTKLPNKASINVIGKMIIAVIIQSKSISTPTLMPDSLNKVESYISSGSFTKLIVFLLRFVPSIIHIK
jgi:hypothetical protein